MQWCQRLEADYGVDPWIWQPLDGPSFCHSSRLCNSFHGYFVPNSMKGQSVHTLVFVLLEFDFAERTQIELSLVRLCRGLENTEVDAHSQLLYGSQDPQWRS